MAFVVKQKAKLLGWYRQNGPITQTQRNYRTKYAETPSVENSIDKWGRNLEEHGTVEVSQASERRAAASAQKRETQDILCNIGQGRYAEQSSV